MFRQIALLLTVSLLGFSLSSEAQVQRYDKQTVRQYLLDLGANPPIDQTQVVGEVAGEKESAFLNYFLRVIEPRDIAISRLGMKYQTYNLLMDSGSYNDQAEYKLFQDEFQKLAEAFNEYSVDPAITAEFKEWARLAEGLNGDMPTYARRLAWERDLESFPPELKPKLDEIEKLETEFELALKDAPSNAQLQEVTSGISEVVSAFKGGKISLADSKKRLAELYQKGGYTYVGRDAVLAKGENLNRVAVLRSELAKAKGFKTWAEYGMERNGQGYETNYRGPKKQREFLQEMIRGLRPVQDYLLKTRLAALQIPAEEMREQYISFLTYPSLLQIREHFPIDKITDMWEATMVASGFSPAVLSQILVDDEFRESKNLTEAYMAGILSPHTGKSLVDGKTLNIIEQPKNSPDWKPGFTYILQSYKSPGVSGLETAFHEGGHALEKAYKLKQLPLPESYGYVEVPSMTMEYFVRDPEVLFNLAEPVNGQRPTLERVQELVSGYEKNGIFSLMSLATDALFDLEIWDYDYSAPGAMTYLQRAEKLHNELSEMSDTYPSIPLQVPEWYGRVSTTHYTNGAVRYMGYVYAEIGSAMMSAYVSDEIEKATGRRSWYNQPGLAEIFGDKFFSVGWRKKFPANIEEITGRKFDPKSVVETVANRIGLPKSAADCEAALCADVQ